MDLYCSDKKLSELTESPLGDFFDTDFTPPVNSMETSFGLESGGSGDADWLDTFFDDPVLNDRMISDALTPAPGQQQQQTGGVQSEHSYSLHNHNDEDDGTTLDLSSKQNVDVKDLDMELTGMNPNSMTLSSSSKHTSLPVTASSSIQRTTAAAAANTSADLYIKQEPLDLSLDTEMTTVTVTRSTNPQTLLKQPTIILATTTSNNSNSSSSTASTLPTLRQERLVLPKVEIKMEPQQHGSSTAASSTQRYTHSIIASPEHSSESFDSLSLPPTPPSSTNSDSDGGERSPPCSPHRSSRHHHHHRPTSPLVQQPFFMSPIPTSGVLMLTEEEKRTLISEGYPIPSKLPLTKQEEKNLKKIRRKIKNKISAQESRRKKKEYLETLERKVEAYSQENLDLKKKVDHLQNDNHSLLSQLHKLQASVRSFSASTTHSATGTCLMVLVLCFAVSLSAWSPMSLSMGYSTSVSLTASPSSPSSSSASSSSSSSSPVAMYPFSPTPDLMGRISVGVGAAVSGKKQQQLVNDGGIRQQQQQQPEDPSVTTYATPNMRSRVLLAMKEEEEEEEFGPHAPFSYKWLFGGIFGGGCAATAGNSEQVVPSQSHQPTLPRVNVMDVETEINQTGGAAASHQPDIAVTTSNKPINATS